ncbi:MAG: hypothetical protein B7Y62_00345 [Sphingomonadales bacterium 35-56-22]|nr:MAG: hypothetical protein B7Y62_00345 [Sphingomonadales bacterium 35-56-22]OYY98948.1 MAG: hypothetical protein B7Y38_00345 [Sphingomonadales bacterium 28-56-43]OYZ60419.1 MAG: hypothetical protein B7Y10_07155 [Sphingomonadales bacterium 24-56-14]
MNFEVRNKLWRPILQTNGTSRGMQNARWTCCYHQANGTLYNAVALKYHLTLSGWVSPVAQPKTALKT